MLDLQSSQIENVRKLSYWLHLTSERNRWTAEAVQYTELLRICEQLKNRFLGKESAKGKNEKIAKAELKLETSRSLFDAL